MAIYTIKHNSIDFSSVNPLQVEHYEKVLCGVSLDDIKTDRIKGRHALLLNMGLAGDCPLFDEYMRIRAKKHQARESFLSSLKKNASMVVYGDKRMLVNDAAELFASQSVYSVYGWVI